MEGFYFIPFMYGDQFRDISSSLCKWGGKTSQIDRKQWIWPENKEKSHSVKIVVSCFVMVNAWNRKRMKESKWCHNKRKQNGSRKMGWQILYGNLHSIWGFHCCCRRFVGFWIKNQKLMSILIVEFAYNFPTRDRFQITTNYSRIDNFKWNRH